MTLAAVLFAHNILTGRQRAAADRFAMMRVEIFGGLLGGRKMRPPGRNDAGQLERRYGAMLHKLTTAQQVAVVGLALGQRETWMRAQLHGLPLTAEHRRERRDLLGGLDRLAARYLSKKDIYVGFVCSPATTAPTAQSS